MNSSLVYNEISIHRALKHENIIEMFNASEDSTKFYLVLELATEGSLFDLLKQKGKLSEKEAFPYFIQVANALNFLHENKIVHRDVKPENVLLIENKAKLCDFGWSEVMDSPFNLQCGTPEYVAPEIILGEEYRLTVDCWALGVLLFELLHGFTPFNPDKASEETVYDRIVNENHQITANISSECKECLDSLLRKENRISIQAVFSTKWVKKMEQVERLKRKKALNIGNVSMSPEQSNLFKPKSNFKIPKFTSINRERYDSEPFDKCLFLKSFDFLR